MKILSLKQLFEENGGNSCYYPLRNLYATCSSFSWLNELEYICVEEGELYYNIVTRNINGVHHGITYNGNVTTGILGYTLYDNGKIIKENCRYNDYHYNYRCVNGITYYEHEDCLRWYNDCNENCKNCIQLNKIQKYIFEKDPGIEKIFNTEYDDCKVIIRTPVDLDSIPDYDVDGLVIAS